jgi:hypothetical protein
MTKVLKRQSFFPTLKIVIEQGNFSQKGAPRAAAINKTERVDKN